MLGKGAKVAGWYLTCEAEQGKAKRSVGVCGECRGSWEAGIYSEPQETDRTSHGFLTRSL